MVKSVFRIGPVVAVMMLVGVLGSCQTPAPNGITEVPDTVPVTMGGEYRTPEFTPDPVRVLRGNYIRWTNPYGGTVLVHLERVPVTPTLVEIPEGGTGVVRVLHEAPTGIFKYGVTLMIAGDTIVVDPYIDVPEEGGRGTGD